MKEGIIKWNQSSSNTWHALVYFVDSNLFRIDRTGSRGKYTYNLAYLHPSWTIHSAAPGWKEYASYPELELAKTAAQRAYDEFVEGIIKEQKEKNK